jgi:hypothetical protein
MREQLRYPVYDTYPKGDEQRYDINNPQPKLRVEVIERKKHD